MKNRTIIGIVCIVLALIVTFAVAPMVNKISDSRTDIVRMKKDVDQGHLISDDDIEIVTVGSHGLAIDTITKKEDVVGKFAACDLKVGDSLFPSKLSLTSDSADDVFHTLNGEKQAISITISTFAGGLSGKLENGDIISLIVFDNDTNEAFIPAGLTYVKVITTTTQSGFDFRCKEPKINGIAYTLPNIWLVTHRARSIQQRRSYMYRGYGCCFGSHSIIAHQRTRRGYRIAN